MGALGGHRNSEEGEVAGRGKKGGIKTCWPSEQAVGRSDLQRGCILPIHVE